MGQKKVSLFTNQLPYPYSIILLSQFKIGLPSGCHGRFGRTQIDYPHGNLRCPGSIAHNHIIAISIYILIMIIIVNVKRSTDNFCEDPLIV